MGAAGAFFLAVGAILYWVVEPDLPYVDDNALGAILIVGGIVALTVSVLARSQLGNRGVGSGIGLIAAGAIVTWAIDLDLPNVDDDALGIILIVAGIVLAVASMIVNTERTEAGVGAGVALIAAGAIVFWAVELDLPFVSDDALAIILMLAGALGVIASVVTQLRPTRDVRDVPGEARRYDGPSPRA